MTTVRQLEPIALERAEAFDRAAAAAAAHVRNPHAPSTERAYRVQWDAWHRYALERGAAVVPIDPYELVTFLQLRSQQGAAPNTVRLALAALASLDLAARTGEPDPASLRAHPIVRRWFAGWAREHPKAPRRQAPAIEPRQLEQLLLAAAERPHGASRAQHTALYVRDRALILIGVCGALRVSELVGLDAGDVVIGERGLSVLVRRSKVDQHGEGHLRALVHQARVLRCPVDAWRAWLTVRGQHEGPAFVGFDRTGVASGQRLSESAARRIVTRRAAAVGLELVTSHSLRATFATLAAERRKPLHRIAQQGDWRSLDQVRGYVRQGELFDDPTTAGLLDD